MSGYDKNKGQAQDETKKVEPAQQVGPVKPVSNADTQDAMPDAGAQDLGYLSLFDPGAGIATSGPPPVGPVAPDADAWHPPMMPQPGLAEPAPVVDTAAQQKAKEEAAAKAKAELDAKNRAMAHSIQAELDDAVGIGLWNRADAGATKRLLAGRTPEEMAMIRKVYEDRTGRTLEHDVSDQFDGKDGNQMMANVMQGMDLTDRLEHFDTSKSLLNAVNQASDKEIQELVGFDPTKAGEDQDLDDSILKTLRDKGMDDDDLMAVRMRLFKGDAKKQREAVGDRITATNGYFNDDEGAAMTALAKLPLEDRKLLLAENEEMLGHLNATERARMHEIASSETAALKARMLQATEGGGTDDDAVGDIAADAGRLNAEEKALTTELGKDGLTEERKAEIEKRLGELGEVGKLLTPERNKDGSFKDGTFFDQLDSDVKDHEVESYMETMGVEQYEISKQAILNGMDNFNDDESAVREAFAKLPDKKDRLKLYSEMFSTISGGGGIGPNGLSNEDMEKVEKFVFDDRAGMAEIRIDEADGVFGQDEAKVYQAYMGLSEDERKKVGETEVGKKAREMMDPAEQAAYDEVHKDGALSIETGTAAATDGWGTNNDVLDLTYERKSDEATADIREGLVLAKTMDPSQMNPAQKEKFDLYAKATAQLEADMDGDEYQKYLDQLVGHSDEYLNHYTGKKEGGTSAEAERQDADGRVIGTQLTNLRAEEKMGDDGDGGGGLASWFSDTDQTAIDSFQTQLSAHDMALADGEVDLGEFDDHQTKGKTFDEDYQSMLDAQNAITDGVAMGAGITLGVLAAAASGGLLGAPAAALLANLGTVGTAITSGTAVMGIKEAVGGDRYDITGEAGQTDLAMTLVDAGLGKLHDVGAEGILGKADEALEGASLAKKAPRILQENAVKTGLQAGTDTVKDTVTNEDLYKGDWTTVGDVVLDSAGNAVKNAPKNFVEGTLKDGVSATGKHAFPDRQPTKHEVGPFEYYKTAESGSDAPVRTDVDVTETNTKAPRAPKIEDATAPKVEEASTPKVEEATTPKVEDAAAPKTDDAVGRLNQADGATLQEVDGIGPTLADRVTSELENGGFTSAEDLATRVNGIGPKKAEAILKHLNGTD